ncbi:MAG: ABC transporter ATP-binding protein, partial [Bacilli bacterium]
KSFSKEKDEIKDFDKTALELADVTRKIGYVFAVVIPVFMLIVNLAIVWVLYLTLDLAKQDPSITSALFSYVQYLSQIMMALIIGGMVMMQVGRAMVSIKRFDEIMQHDSIITYQEEGITSIKGNIRFENVSFIYPNEDKPALKNISFEVKQGETLGIIGATGSGKSTLVNLILRLYDVSEGAIYIDNVNIKEIPKDTLRGNVSMVLQRPILFSGTIKENLVPLNSKYTKDEMELAAMDAQANEFISRMNLGFESEVLQRGSNFSGGQKQRLSIARALIGKPPIIILDDSTSALDARSEKLVKEALYKSYQDETIIIIAQKITSVIDANKILVLDNGEIDAIGSHSSLVKESPIYLEIFNTQKGGKNNE